METLVGVYVGLEIDLKDMLLYKFRHLFITDDLYVDNFPDDILQAAKDPIIGITKFYMEIRNIFDHGFDKFIESSDKISRDVIFEQAGREMLGVLECITNNMTAIGVSIDMFNYAKYDCRSILLLSINSLEHADIL
jgi:hypothetical protein